MALLGSAFLLGTGLSMKRFENAVVSDREISELVVSANLLSGNTKNEKVFSSSGTAFDFILSTVSADFALPDRKMSA